MWTYIYIKKKEKGNNEGVGKLRIAICRGRLKVKVKMSFLWEKSETWRWIVRKSRDSKPFFLAFATVCGVVPGVIGYCVMQFTSSRNPELEAQLRKNARSDSLVCFNPLFCSIFLSNFSAFALPFIDFLLVVRITVMFFSFVSITKFGGYVYLILCGF